MFHPLFSGLLAQISTVGQLGPDFTHIPLGFGAGELIQNAGQVFQLRLAIGNLLREKFLRIAGFGIFLIVARCILLRRKLRRASDKWCGERLLMVLS